jgi:hypothetical protein
MKDIRRYAMSWMDDLQREIDRAGEAAKLALEEGRLRMDLHRARRRADEAAQALGYAAHRAKAGDAAAAGTTADGGSEPLAGYHESLAERQAEVRRLEAELAEVRGKARSTGWGCRDADHRDEHAAAGATHDAPASAGSAGDTGASA